MNINENTIILNEIILKSNEKLILRKAMTKDAKAMLKYVNIVAGESDNLTFGENQFPLTVQQEMEYIERITNHNNSLIILGTIKDRIVALSQITTSKRERICHNSEFAISVKKEYWSMGIGTLVLNEIINFAKETNTIKNISLGVKEDNVNAIKLYEKCGFKKVGVHKAFFNIDGKFYDEILMDLYI